MFVCVFVCKHGLNEIQIGTVLTGVASYNSLCMVPVYNAQRDGADGAKCGYCRTISWKVSCFFVVCEN